MLRIFSNDKATAKDEVVLMIFVAICILIGVVGVIWQYNTPTTVFAVLCIVTGIMFIPSIVWRLHENYKTNK